jgi:hypothetical protein
VPHPYPWGCGAAWRRRSKSVVVPIPSALPRKHDAEQRAQRHHEGETGKHANPRFNPPARHGRHRPQHERRRAEGAQQKKTALSRIPPSRPLVIRGKPESGWGTRSTTHMLSVIHDPKQRNSVLQGSFVALRIFSPYPRQAAEAARRSSHHARSPRKLLRAIVARLLGRKGHSAAVVSASAS